MRRCTSAALEVRPCACRDTVVEITATVATAFLCFWFAEEIAEVSGVLAVVMLAIWVAALGKYAISPDVVVRLLSAIVREHPCFTFSGAVCCSFFCDQVNLATDGHSCASL